MDEGEKICPVCGETIKRVAIKCRFCGEDLVAFAAKKDAEIERELFAGHPAAVYRLNQYFAIAITLGLAYIYYWFISRAIKYQITTQRVIVERGLLSKTKSSIELFRVDDFNLSYPLNMRILGYGALRITSSDRNLPVLTICGIDQIDAIYEKLRENSLRERENRRVNVWADA